MKGQHGMKGMKGAYSMKSSRGMKGGRAMGGRMGKRAGIQTPYRTAAGPRKIGR